MSTTPSTPSGTKASEVSQNPGEIPVREPKTTTRSGKVIHWPSRIDDGKFIHTLCGWRGLDLKVSLTDAEVTCKKCRLGLDRPVRKLDLNAFRKQCGETDENMVDRSPEQNSESKNPDSDPRAGEDADEVGEPVAP